MSRMFEMLQKAQRDQELLKLASPQAALHSRNLDVLHHAGKDQQIFDIPPLQDDAQTAPEPAPPPNGFSRGETYKLIQQLFLSPNHASPRAVVFCGVDADGERGWICAQTAELLINLKQGSACVVDANVANPTLHSYFGVENNRGLSDALVQTGPAIDFTQSVGRGRLRLLSAGVPSIGLNSGPVLASARLAARMRELRASFDYLLLSAPPISRDSVTGYLSALADGVVLIVEPSFTPRQATLEMKDEIEAAGGKILGVVLHRRSLSLSDKTNSTPPKPANGHAR